MRTAKIELSEIHCSDGWFELGNDLGFSSEKINNIFQYGEFGTIEIEIDENLNIIGGRIIPFLPIEDIKPLRDVPKYADLIELNDFVECCQFGGFIDSDGYGEYTIDGKMSGVPAYPSDILGGFINRKFTHVAWFNK